MNSPLSSTALPQSHSEIIDELIDKQRFGVEYQPIIELCSGEIVAFEALARFYTPSAEMISPQQVFDVLHNEPEKLIETELALKKLQLDNAPEAYQLFLNIDPHAVDCKPDNPCELMCLIGSSNDVVVELIENSDIHEARMSERIHNFLRQRGIKTALDDIGADHALLSLEIFSLVDFLKFDRSWLQKLQQPRYQKLFHSILNYSAVSEKHTVLEGIETDQQMETAKEYQIEFVQGFKFRSLFRQVKP